jgi:glycosyltransferase involved in cell wall biosynthesis
MTLPRTAYILLWFPKPSETFVFHEVTNLRRQGLPLQVFTLYGKWPRDLSAEMRAVGEVERLGFPTVKSLAPAIRYWRRSNPVATRHLLRTAFTRCWRDGVKGAENFWAILCAFPLARRLATEGIEHIHAPWASGPATAAWGASRLTGIPFTFTARAWDIYPPDKLIGDKIREAIFVRCETAANIRHLTPYAAGDEGRFRLTYNGVPLATKQEAPVNMQPPYKLLALGRFVRKKGFDHLLRAVRILKDQGLYCHLTLAGAGQQGAALQRLARRLDIAGRVRFPGFVPHDRISELFLASDIFVMPSIIAPSGNRDGLPTVILEALLHRLPVIATNISGIPEVIEDKVTGRLIPEKDPTAIAQAIRDLIADRAGAIAMAERGRAQVRDQFDADRNHRRLLELYQGLPRPQTRSS